MKIVDKLKWIFLWLSCFSFGLAIHSICLAETDYVKEGDKWFNKPVTWSYEQETAYVTRAIACYLRELIRLKQEEISSRSIKVHDIPTEQIVPNLNCFINECDHESDGATYTSNPPQYKCKKCGKFYFIDTKAITFN